MSSDSGAIPPGLRLRTLLEASSANVVGALPAWLLGALAVLVREDLDATRSDLGFASAGFFLTSAVGSLGGGRLSQRVGPHLATMIGVLLSALALGGMAVLADTWLVLVGFLLVGGIANGLSQPATNLAVSELIALEHQGVAYGIKQASIPMGTLFAGLAVPIVAANYGWRISYVVAALLALVTLWAVRLRKDSWSSSAGAREPKVRLLEGRLVLVTLGAMAAGATATAMVTFMVESITAAGVSPSGAGWILVAGSIAGVVARVMWGVVADARHTEELRTVAFLLACGAAAMALLAISSNPFMILVATLVAFGAGWGWSGLFNLAIVRDYPLAAGAATGATQAGIFVGAVAGPAGFGIVVDRYGFQVAWMAAAVIMAGGAVLVLFGSALDHVSGDVGGPDSN